MKLTRSGVALGAACTAYGPPCTDVDGGIAYVNCCPLMDPECTIPWECDTPVSGGGGGGIITLPSPWGGTPVPMPPVPAPLPGATTQIIRGVDNKTLLIGAAAAVFLMVMVNR